MNSKHLHKLFRYEHLPAELQLTSKPFHDLAMKLFNDLNPSAETTLVFRKLWDAKNLAVWSAANCHEGD